jgi:hypothetical protein
MNEKFKVGMYTRTMKLTFEKDCTISDIKAMQNFLVALLDNIPEPTQESENDEWINGNDKPRSATVRFCAINEQIKD